MNIQPDIHSGSPAVLLWVTAGAAAAAAVAEYENMPAGGPVGVAVVLAAVVVVVAAAGAAAAQQVPSGRRVRELQLLLPSMTAEGPGLQWIHWAAQQVAVRYCQAWSLLQPWWVAPLRAAWG